MPILFIFNALLLFPKLPNTLVYTELKNAKNIIGALINKYKYASLSTVANQGIAKTEESV